MRFAPHAQLKNLGLLPRSQSPICGRFHHPPKKSHSREPCHCCRNERPGAGTLESGSPSSQIWGQAPSAPSWEGLPRAPPRHGDGITWVRLQWPRFVTALSCDGRLLSHQRLGRLPRGPTPSQHHHAGDHTSGTHSFGGKHHMGTMAIAVHFCLRGSAYSGHFM